MEVSCQWYGGYVCDEQQGCIHDSQVGPRYDDCTWKDRHLCSISQWRSCTMGRCAYKTPWGSMSFAYVSGGAEDLAE